MPPKAQLLPPVQRGRGRGRGGQQRFNTREGEGGRGRGFREMRANASGCESPRDQYSYQQRPYNAADRMIRHNLPQDYDDRHYGTPRQRGQGYNPGYDPGRRQYAPPHNQYYPPSYPPPGNNPMFGNPYAQPPGEGQWQTVDRGRRSHQHHQRGGDGFARQRGNGGNRGGGSRGGWHQPRGGRY